MKKALLIFIIFITFQSYSQLGIDCIENKNSAKIFAQKETISKNQILFIFNIKNKKIDVEYEGPIDDKNTDEIGLIKLYVPTDFSDSKSGVNTGRIKIFSTKDNTIKKCTIDYGNVVANDGVKKFRGETGIKGGETIYFDVEIKKPLPINETTLNNLGNGMQIETANDGVIFLEVEPPNLEFEVNDQNNESINNITKPEEAKKGKYKYLIKANLPKDAFFTIKTENYIDKNIPISGFTKLVTKFYGIKVEKEKNSKIKFTVNSIPLGAIVHIEGADSFNANKFETPCKVELKAGDYNVTFTKTGYKTKSIKMEFGFGGSDVIELEQKIGFLNIPSSINNIGAEVFVDNELIGIIPISNHNLKEGSHNIRFQKENYKTSKSNYIINIIADKNFIFDNFSFTRNRPKNSFERLKYSAEEGNLDSQYELATKYSMGSSLVRKDTSKALYWYKKSADSGFSKSQEELGAMYFQKNDYKNAFIWYSKASNNGVVRAQYVLGYLYKNGFGTKKSKKNAKYWWKKSCRLGWKNSCTEMKKMNAFGNALLKSVGNSIRDYKPKN